ncbi:MAG TPA: type IV pilus secretin PilQ, partial [Gammaproteobacteria bacterium]
ELEAKKKIEEVAPLRTRYFTINYAKATDIASLLKGEKNTILSPRGSVTIDSRTNTLMILDTDEKLAELEALIKRLDIPVRQVLIESRVVIATSSYSKELGSRFGVTDISNNPPGSGGQGAIATSGTLASTNTIANNVIANNNTIPNPAVSAFAGTGASRLNTDFAATGNAASIALAVLGADYLVDLELSALQQEGKGEVLSNPRVITANQKEAMIKQGIEIPYQSSTGTGTNSIPKIEFKEADLIMKVTPHITPDDRIIMDLNVKKDNVGGYFAGQPSIDRREINTQVLVKSGETVVLGGVYEQSRTDDMEKVPLLGDIPLLGALFRYKKNTSAQSELLIFVTPKILKQSLQAGLN